ncbi:MAG TPA: hypothetical protein VG228_08265, partial [Solirubrobacteraceae bacterium]|nr:hypothetical protein [Solirubrobacteraceae bacterium]
MFAATVAGLVQGVGTASGRSLSGASTGSAAPGAPPVTEVDPGPDSSVAVTSGSDTMAAMYGVASLTGGETVLLGATDSTNDTSDGQAADTDLQVAIVTGASVNRVNVPLPAGATAPSAYIGGAAVTALSNGNFAVLYWGSNSSDGALVVQGQNATLPDYYVQVFAPDGSTVGSLATLVYNGTEGNAAGSIAEDGANSGFVVAANTDDATDVVVQRYTNGGATSGTALSFSGLYPYSTVVDSQGDVTVQFEDVSSGGPEYLFVPNGATSSSSSGVVAEAPLSGEVTTDPSGGFVDFSFSGSDLEARTISTSGTLGSVVALGDVGSIASNDIIWSAVALSGGGYALTLEPSSGNTLTGYPATYQVIEVSSLAAGSTTIEDLTTTSGGASAPVGPWAVADGSGGIATYTDIPGSGTYSPAGFPLNASLSATTYLDSGPTVTAGGTASFTAGGAGVALDSTLGVTDGASPTLSSATVSIASGLLSGDQLSADTSGTSITASYNAGTGVLTLTGSDTVAHYQQVLDSVSYSFSGDPTNGGTDTSRTINWAINDGTTTSSTVTSTLTVQLQTQAALTVTSTSGTYGTALTLTASGGSGSGAVTYVATNGTASGCAVSGPSLRVTSAGTCSVTATKAADSTYASVASAPTTVTFAKASQAALTVTSTSGTVGTALTLTTSGGSGSGTVSYTAVDGTAAGCSVSGTTLTTSSSGTCTVTATKAADADYNQVSSAATTVMLAGQTQAALTVTSTSGTYGTALVLTSSGGSGSGAVSYTATDGTASGCTVSGSSLSVA